MFSDFYKSLWKEGLGKCNIIKSLYCRQFCAFSFYSDHFCVYIPKIQRVKK